MQTLEPVVGKSVWPLVCPLEDKPKAFVTFVVEYDVPADYGDDTVLGWTHYVSICYFKKSVSNKKPANIIKERSDIRAALIEAGFSVTRITYFHDMEEGYSELVFSVNIQEDDVEGD